MVKSSRLSSRSLLRVATAMAVVLVPSAAFAQAASAADDQANGALEDIVVTARRSSESAQNVPIAITTVTAQNLRRLSVRDIVDIQKVTPECTQLSELLLRCAERVQSAVGLMASMADAPAILKICQEIDQLESEADRVMRGAISELFRNETDVRQVIKLKAVYEALESATDKCQDVANVIESVVLENA